MVHQSLPVTPNPPRCFLVQRIRVNFVITVPASDVREAQFGAEGARRRPGSIGIVRHVPSVARFEQAVTCE